MNILATYHISLFLRYHLLEYASLFYLSLRKKVLPIRLWHTIIYKMCPSFRAVNLWKFNVSLQNYYCKAHQRIFYKVQVNKSTINDIQLQIHIGYKNKSSFPGRQVQVYLSCGIWKQTVHHSQIQELFSLWHLSIPKWQLRCKGKRLTYRDWVNPVLEA